MPEKKEQTIYSELSAPIGEKGIQRTKGIETKRGYDTTGYGYQFLVNRFNDALGVGKWNWGYKVIREQEGKFSSGAPYFDITIEATITVEGIEHTEPGGHRSSNYADALKGASTNGFKKAAAFFGVGKDAFEGSIDEDNKSRGGTDGEGTVATTRMPDRPATSKQVEYLYKLLKERGAKDKNEALKMICELTGDLITGADEITMTQAKKLIDHLKGEEQNKDIPVIND